MRRVLLLIVASVALATAQQPPPRINYVFPAGATRGTTNVAVFIGGAELQSAFAVRFSSSALSGTVVKVEHPTAVRISVTVAPDAPLGEHDLRLLTPGGASNRQRFFVGQLPEINEVEPNNEPAKAQLVGSFPVLINGQITDRDRDLFRFSAKAGQTIVCQIEARKLIPYISDAVPGWLDATLRLCDAHGKELAFADDHHSDPDPLLIHKIPADGDYFLEVRDVIHRGRGDFVYRLTISTEPYVAPTVPFVSGTPERIASAGTTHRVEPPVTVSGCIKTRGQTDLFTFAAQKDQVLIFEVFARRLGSPLDAIVTLLNDKGEELREVDDTETGEPLLVHFADPRFDYRFPAAGNYTVKLRDVQSHFGDDYTYRLRIAPPRPDFSLRIVPDAVRVGQGETILIPVTAVRKDWFGGEIILSTQNLPPGWLASSAVIFAGQNETQLTLTAPRDAPTNSCVAPIIVGKAKIGETEVVRNAEPTEDVTQAFSYHHLVPTKEFVVTVSEAPPFTLSVTPSGLSLSPESEIQILVKAFRKPGANREIALSLHKPPVGVSAKPAVIPADKDETTLIVVAAKDAAAGPRPHLIISGAMTTDKGTVTGFAPAIPIQIIPRK